MRKLTFFLLLFLLLPLLLSSGCTPKEKALYKESLLWKFYDTHSFEGEYTLETTFLITPKEGEPIEQVMTFAKKGDQYARTLTMDQLSIRSFNANHHMITIDENTKEVKRSFLPKNEDPGQDIRQVIIGRENLLSQKPRVETEGDTLIETYEDAGITYRYGFVEEELRWIEMPSEEGTVRINLLSIHPKANPDLFRIEEE